MLNAGAMGDYVIVAVPSKMMVSEYWLCPYAAHYSRGIRRNWS
jgi:BarA-like signal transduction histidine kinase